MGLLQKAVETCDAMAHRAGIPQAEEKEPLAPISHIMARAQVEITLNQDGKFCSARAIDKDAPKVIIPATEESAGRTVKAAELPHPLCDYLRYLIPYNQVEYSCYVRQLSDWAASEYSMPKIQAILCYAQGGTILRDLQAAGLLQLGPDGKPVDERAEKWMVCWTVNGLGEGANGPCWKDQTLMKSFSDYSAEKQADSALSLCMISGKEETSSAQHPKGIVPASGNAKLISANDSSGFTYRGRFSKDWQAATVSYAASQKAHCALRWLVANQGVSFGGRTFLCWNPQGCPVPPIHSPMMRGNVPRTAAPTQYRQQLLKALSGWKNKLPDQAGVVIAAFDAATTGRLAVTYYNELQASDFLERLKYWDETCCWENGQSPTLFQFVNYAFGTLRNGKAEPDDRIRGQQMQRLVACRIDKTRFPFDIERALVEKATNLQIYKGKTGAETKKLRRELLFVVCAAIRKYHIDQFKEEWDMALDESNTNRSYLFGRLLAIAEAVESSTYTDEDRRETNAMRMQKAFALRPLSTWRMLEEKLEPYYRQLSPGLRGYYQKFTREIVDKLSPSDSCLNQKLDDIYLLGYYHQRAYRNGKSNDLMTEEE